MIDGIFFINQTADDNYSYDVIWVMFVLFFSIHIHLLSFFTFRDVMIIASIVLREYYILRGVVD